MDNLENKLEKIINQLETIIKQSKIIEDCLHTKPSFEYLEERLENIEHKNECCYANKGELYGLKQSIRVLSESIECTDRNIDELANSHYGVQKYLEEALDKNIAAIALEMAALIVSRFVDVEVDVNDIYFKSKSFTDEEE